MSKDDLFDRIEKKTNVSKYAILEFARKLQDGNFKDEKVLRSIIKDISEMTGKEVSEEKEQKIIDMVVNDKVPKDIDKYV